MRQKAQSTGTIYLGAIFKGEREGGGGGAGSYFKLRL